MPTWPGTLPQAFPIGTTEAVQDGRVRSAMDAGPAKLRRRFTAVVRTYTLPAERFVFTDAQKATYETFFTSTLSGGTLEFDWTDPWPSAGTKTFRIVSPMVWDPFTTTGSARTLTFGLVLEEMP